MPTIWASDRTRLNFRIQPSQFSPYFIDPEPPLDWLSLFGFVFLPKRDVLPHCLDVRHPFAQALFVEDVESDFGHVEPASVLGREHKPEPVKQGLGDFGPNPC